MALLIDYTRSGSEAVLVNGATLRATAGPVSSPCLGVNRAMLPGRHARWPRRMHGSRFDPRMRLDEIRD